MLNACKPVILMSMMRIFFVILNLIAGMAVVLPQGAMAAPEGQELSSPWITGPHTRARIVAMPWDGRSRIRLGVQLDLEPGWKTYWRNPGDAGIPPRFSWKGSSNIKTPKLSWPAPERMADEFGVSIGYKHGALLPVRIEAVQAGKPINLALEVNYGVCAEVCIPVTSHLKFKLEPVAARGGPYDKLILRWQTRVPKPAADTGLDIVSIKPFSKSGKVMFEVAILGKGGLRKPALFVEGPKSYYFSVPELISHSKEGAVYRFEVDDIQSHTELKGQKLAFTLSDETRAAEKNWVLE